MEVFMKVFKKIILLVFVFGGLLIATGPASAFLIRFDNLAPGLIIDNINLGGVTISSAPGFTMVVSPPLDFLPNGVGWRTPKNAILNFNPAGGPDGITTIPLVMTFAVPQSSIAFSGGDRGGDMDQFTVTAFDKNNNLLGVFNTGWFGGNPLLPFAMADFFTVNLNWPGMKTVVVSNAISQGIGVPLDGIGIDSIQFCQIPLPSTVMLLASGLLGIIGLKRRMWR
jgi:hypothetical protein